MHLKVLFTWQKLKKRTLKQQAKELLKILKTATKKERDG